MMSSKTSTGNIKDGGIEGTPQLFRIPQSTQTPQIPTQPVPKLHSYPLSLELADIQPRLGWYHSPGFKLQLQSCYNKSVIAIGELSTPVTPCSSGSSSSNHQQAHGQSPLPHHQHWNTKSSNDPVGAETVN